MKSGVVALIATITLAMNACSSPKTANKENFTKAINALYADHCVTIRANPYGVKLTDRGYPIFVPDAVESAKQSAIPSVLRSMTGMDAHSAMAAAQYDALEKAGLLSSTATRVKMYGWRAERSGLQYSLTDAGKKHLEKPGGIDFCVAHRRVDEIVRYTQPTTDEGRMLSDAFYVYSYPDPSSWSRNPAVQAAFPKLAEQLAPHQEGRARLVLMNDGWAAAPW